MTGRGHDIDRHQLFCFVLFDFIFILYQYSACYPYKGVDSQRVFFLFVFYSTVFSCIGFER